MPTDIEWCDETWNPIIGCSKISAGCRGCYAERMAARQAAMGREDYQHVVTPAGNWLGQTRFVESALDKPRRWTRKPRRIFLGSMTDIFHRSVQPQWLDRVLEVVAAGKMHTHLALTKRASSIDPKLYDASDQAPRRLLAAGETMANLHLGVTIENQVAADIRLPHLMELAACGWTTYVSCEPLLTHLDLANFLGPARLAGVIVGGETGPQARPMNPEWVRSIRDQCAAAGVPFFFKSWGAWVPDSYRDWRKHERIWLEPDGPSMWRHGQEAKQLDRHRLLDGRRHNDLAA